MWKCAVLCLLGLVSVGGVLISTPDLTLTDNDFEDGLTHYSVEDISLAERPPIFLETATGKKVPMQQKFDMKCMCVKELVIPESGKIPVDIPFGKCAATEVRIKSEEEGVGLSIEDVRSHIGNPLKLQWAKVPKHHFSDIEGRTSHPILATPGGDLGEWVLALAIYEGLVNKELAINDVVRFFKLFLRSTGKMSFYFHTDRQSTEVLGKMLSIERLDLTDTPPNEDVKLSLLRKLTLPGNTGSEHFKLLLQNSYKYNVRKDLVKLVIEAFFRILWDKGASPPIWQKLRLVTLEGTSDEKAFLKIKVAAECVANQVAPLIKPKESDTSVYVVHRQAIEAFRKEVADFFADQDPKIDAEKFRLSMDELGDRHLEKDIEYLARTTEKRLPVWEVTIL